MSSFANTMFAKNMELREKIRAMREQRAMQDVEIRQRTFDMAQRNHDRVLADRQAEQKLQIERDRLDMDKERSRVENEAKVATQLGRVPTEQTKPELQRAAAYGVDLGNVANQETARKKEYQDALTERWGNTAAHQNKKLWSEEDRFYNKLAADEDWRAIQAELESRGLDIRKLVGTMRARAEQTQANAAMANAFQDPTTGTLTDTQKQLSEAIRTRASLDGIEEALDHDPTGTRLGRAKNFFAEEIMNQNGLGNAWSTDRVKRAQQVRSRILRAFNPYRTMVTGASAPMAELALLEKAFMDNEGSTELKKIQLEELKAWADKVIRVNQVLLDKGIPVTKEAINEYWHQVNNTSGGTAAAPTNSQAMPPKLDPVEVERRLGEASPEQMLLIKRAQDAAKAKANGAPR